VIDEVTEGDVEKLEKQRAKKRDEEMELKRKAD